MCKKLIFINSYGNNQEIFDNIIRNIGLRVLEGYKPYLNQLFKSKWDLTDVISDDEWICKRETLLEEVRNQCRGDERVIDIMVSNLNYSKGVNNNEVTVFRRGDV